MVSFTPSFLSICLCGTSPLYFLPVFAFNPSAITISAVNRPTHHSTTALSAEKDVGHGVRSAAKMGPIDPEELKLQERLAEHQSNVPKLGFPTDVRTLVEYNHGFAVMSTNSVSNSGFPSGSVVAFAPDSSGRPLFVFSSMSSHTKDLLKDGRCSLTIASKEFKGAADGRVNLLGECKRVPKEEQEAVRETYLKKHPGAFWVDFGDFTWYRMEVADVRFVGGFARAGSITGESYADASPDVISSFGPHVAKHMNDDHSSATVAMVGSAVEGLVVDAAEITSIDSLGMYVKVTRTPKGGNLPQQFKIRLPFSRQVEDRKDLKGMIMEMTMAAASKAEEAQ